jgi:hypothetical protein
MKCTQLGKLRQWGEPPLIRNDERDDLEDFPEDRDTKVANLKNPIFYRDLHRYMSRYWKPHIKASEYAVLDFVFDRTIGWGKLWEIISLRHFATGVWNETKVFTDGTGLGKRTIQRALNRLVELGMVRKQGEKGERCWYSLNLLWEPPRFRYLKGKTPCRPAGSKSYWQDVADSKSAETYVIVQRDSEGLVEALYSG